MNLTTYANEIYERGHKPEHFRDGWLKRGIVIVSPVQRPSMSSTGIALPAASTNIPGQFALSHRVEAVGPQTDDALALSVGDIVKVREGHLDILDPTGRLLAIRDEHVIAVIASADDVVEAGAS
jgi:hypothetical protein